MEFLKEPATPNSFFLGVQVKNYRLGLCYPTDGVASLRQEVISGNTVVQKDQ